MGKHTRRLRLVELGSSTASNLVHAPAPRRAPPLSDAARREMSDHIAAVLFLEAVEAGDDKAWELDGELLACCATAARADRSADAFMDRLDALAEDDPRFLPALEAAQPLLDAYAAAVDRAAQIPARTPEGLREKASLLLLHLGTGQDHEALAASLARDITGRA